MSTPSDLQLQLLGAPQVSRRGQPVALPVRKVMALLAYVALEGRATRSKLAALLWSELDEAAARRNLRRELHRLRESGLADALQVADQQIAWNGAACDVHRFDAALARDDIAGALGAYCGSLLDGFDIDAPMFDDWLRARREQLHGRWQKAATAQLKAHQRAGDARSALLVVQQLIANDALQESHYRSAMQLHAELGEREAAMQLFERCRQTLGRELGLRPLPETLALAERIRVGEAPAPQVPVPPSAAAWLPSRAPMVGRDAALAELAAQARRRPAPLLVVSGAAGIGKSRLVAALGDAVGPHIVLDARPSDAQVAFAALTRWLRETLQAGGMQRIPTALHPELARLLPEFGAAPEPVGESQRARLFDALAEGWLASVEPGPRLLVFDDVQWLDAPSFDWALWLHERLAGRLAVAFVARDEELATDRSQRLQALQLEGRASVQRLAPLAGEATLSLVRQLAATGKGERFAQRLHAATGGHPLFLIETLRHLFDTEWLTLDAAGRWQTPVDDTTADYGELPVPASVREAVLARVARLGEGPRRLLEAASCAGGPISFEHIAGATALNEWESLSAFERILAAQLMEPQAAGRYAFVHELVMHSVRDALGDERRRLIHRALAAAMAQDSHDPAAAGDIAQHWTEGALPARASPWWARAAQHAEDLGALPDALVLNRKAGIGAVDPKAIVDLSLQQLRLLSQLSRTEGSAAALERAEAAARASGDATLLARTQLSRAESLQSADPRAADALVTAVLAMPALPALLLSQAQRKRAVLARLRGDLAAAVAASAAALELLPPGQWRSRGAIGYESSLILMLAGRRGEAEAGFAAAAQAFAQARDDASQAKALSAQGSLAADRGEVARSRDLCEQALALARRAGAVSTQRTAILNLVRALVHGGQADDAARRLDEGMALSPQFANINEEQAFRESAFAVALLRGALGDALQAMPGLLALSRRSGEAYRRASGLSAPVDALLQIGLLDEAGALLDEARGIVDPGDLGTLKAAFVVKRAWLALARGEPQAALSGVEPALADPALREQDMAVGRRVRAAAQLALGQAALAGDGLARDEAGLIPEEAALTLACRLDVSRTSGQDIAVLQARAMALLTGGQAPALESLSLWRALRDAGAPTAEAEGRRLVQRLVASLHAQPDAQAALRQSQTPFWPGC